MGLYKPYRKQYDYSYAFGAFAAYELLAARPESVLGVFAHTDFTDGAKLEAECKAGNIPFVIDNRVIERVAQKGNCLVLAVFTKYTCGIDANSPHVCLVNPSDMGNLGSILRSMAAFGYKNLAIIAPAADVFDPKTIRASMGAAFKVNIKIYERFNDYTEEYTGREFFPFMTNGMYKLGEATPLNGGAFTLVFGNEASGLPESFLSVGRSVRIPQTSQVDSLNLSVAVGIGLFAYSGKW